MNTDRLHTVAKEAMTFNGVDVKMVVYAVGVAFAVYLFFIDKIAATEQKITQTIETVAEDNRKAIETVAKDNRLATEKIAVSFQLFVLRQEQRGLLSIKPRGELEEALLVDNAAKIRRAEARQLEIDRLQLVVEVEVE